MEESPGFKDAEIRIEQAKVNSKTLLNLSGLGLTEVPDLISCLTNLKILWLGFNKLSVLPEAISFLTNLRELSLESNHFSIFPDSVSSLANLEKLQLDNNLLSSLPESITSLMNLKKLHLTDNQLRVLPESISSLSNLEKLWLGGNQLRVIPDSISSLTNLRKLWLNNNQIRVLPESISSLANLEILWLNSNQLRILPSSISSLTNLKELRLDYNQLRVLPESLSLITNLEIINIDGNCLISPPKIITWQGTQAILNYLRDLHKSESRQWTSKLFLVGEGGVGKTSLLKALKGEEFIEGVKSTNMLDVVKLYLKHSTEDVKMTLRCWDFGGQEMYHATHQFFLSDRSIFLLVWDARHGWEAGKLNYWLDCIKASAPESPILVIAAHIDERECALPSDDLQKSYPQIQGFYAISNKDRSLGDTIDTLREKIRQVASELPLMGMSWPTSWLNAENELNNNSAKHITANDLSRIVSENGVETDSQTNLIQSLHDLGDILYFKDDKELSDVVILKPQWIASYLSKILDSRKIGSDGILTRNLTNELWSDLDTEIIKLFTKLMQKFDLSYKTKNNDNEICIVVEKLDYNPPDDVDEIWERAISYKDNQELAMRFEMNLSLPPGIPTWFIARAHEFTMRKHWRYGGLFRDAKGKKNANIGRIIANTQEKAVEIAVRGPAPLDFFNKLWSIFEYTVDRYKGLEITRKVPCYGAITPRCNYYFHYEHLQKRLNAIPPKLKIECQAEMEEVEVLKLLYGEGFQEPENISSRFETFYSSLLNEIKLFSSASKSRQEEMLDEIRSLQSLTRREFLKTFNLLQHDPSTACPNIVSFMPHYQEKWEETIFGKKVRLQLWCQYHQGWHTCGDPYTIKKSAEWYDESAPFLKHLTRILKAGLNVATVATSGAEKVAIKAMSEFIGLLPSFNESETSSGRFAAKHHGDLEEATYLDQVGMRAIRKVLDEVDPDHEWRGMEKRTTAEGSYIWLCPEHWKEFDRVK